MEVQGHCVPGCGQLVGGSEKLEAGVSVISEADRAEMRVVVGTYCQDASWSSAPTETESWAGRPQRLWDQQLLPPQVRVGG